MKVLVTGRDGQVARALAERAAGHADLELIFVARPDFDLAKPDTILKTMAAIAPDVVVSAAAWTAVDLAEDEPDAARTCNAVAPGVLAQACHAQGARMIHLSTDYVFSGDGQGAYDENAATGPTGVYGQTKLDGEEAIRADLPDHVIARTAWVYSPFGKNFVKTMLALAETRDELRVVGDQFGNPTSALDIADGLLAILEAWKSGAQTGLGQTFHLAGTGEASWCDFARHVLTESGKLGGPSANVTPITTAEFPTKAKRPANSRLNSDKFARTFDFDMPDWRSSSAKVVQRLLDKA